MSTKSKFYRRAELGRAVGKSDRAGKGGGEE